MTAGRKRSFDKDEALDKAMRVFWDNGYAGTSLADLTAALGINKPSLYAAFGNKEQLFEAALARYMSLYGTIQLPPLSELNSTEEPLKERLRQHLYRLIDMLSDTGTPDGCFLVKSSYESGGVAFPETATAFLQEAAKSAEQQMRAFFEAERARGALPETADLQVMSAYLITVMYGLSVQARAGKPSSALKAVADISVSALLNKTTS